MRYRRIEEEGSSRGFSPPRQALSGGNGPSLSRLRPRVPRRHLSGPAAARCGSARGSVAPTPAGRAQPPRGAVTSDASQSRSAGCAALPAPLPPSTAPTLRAPTFPSSLSGWGETLKAARILPAPRSSNTPGAPHRPTLPPPGPRGAERGRTARPGKPSARSPLLASPARGAAYIFCTGFRRLRLA